MFLAPEGLRWLAEPGLWQSDFEPEGFSWMDAPDNLNSVISSVRRAVDRVSEVVVILNLTPVTRQQYRIGLPRPGKWLELLNSDAAAYAGSNVGNLGGVLSEDVDWHNQPYSAEFTLPPMSSMVFRPEGMVAVEVVETSAKEKAKAKATLPGTQTSKPVNGTGAQYP